MSLVGNLDDLGLGEILQIISLSRKSGILALHHGDDQASIAFVNGHIVSVHASCFSTRLGDILLAKGVLEPGTLTAAVAKQQQEGAHDALGPFLTRVYGIPQQALEEIIREQIACMLSSLAQWVQGSYDFSIHAPADVLAISRKNPLQFMLERGLNTQFLAQEAMRQREERLEPSDLSTATPATGSDTPVCGRPGPGVFHGGQRCMVLVDDDGPTLIKLADGLHQRGFKVFSLGRGEEALIKVDELCRIGQPPVVLMDLIMPRMDGSGVLGGLELLELLHNNFPGLQFLIMSDYHHAEAESHVRQRGCGFIIKPKRSEIKNTDLVQQFLDAVSDFLQPAPLQALTPQSDGFVPAQEFGVSPEQTGEAAPPPPAAADLTLLAGMLEELSCPDLQGGVLLLVLRYASEFLNRAVVFMLEGDVLSGIGQFGISGNSISGDELIRATRLPLHSLPLFQESYRTRRSMVLKPDMSPETNSFFHRLGASAPTEIFIGPIASQSRIIGFLYGDNWPASSPIGPTATLEIFLSQAGQAVDKGLLEHQLLERCSS